MNDCEIILPRRSPRQPNPKVYAGGDCGACVLSGLTGLSVADVYAKAQDGGKVSPFSWPEMIQALHGLLSEGYFKHVITSCPNWITEVYRAPFGFEAAQMNLEWFDYVRLAIEAGYYAICEVCVDGNRAGRRPVLETNHWVLLCGVRVRREPNKAVAGAFNILPEVLVSDSAKSQPPERWVGSQDFLRRHGGFTPLLVLGNDKQRCDDLFQKENERLHQWVDDLQSGMFVNCVYCGYRYGPRDSTPDSMADILRKHIEHCPKHPMSALKKENEALKRKLARLKAHG